MNIRIKRLSVNNNDVDIKILDTAREERIPSISKMQNKDKDGILIRFALNDRKTFKSISYWIKQFFENKGKNSNVSLVIFGKKFDDKNNIVVKEEEEIDKI